MPSTTLRFDWDKFKIYGMDEKAEMSIQMFAETWAKQLETDAKVNRPWTDRSNQARLRITGTVKKIKTGYRIELAHGVDYGMWLELANEGKYGIVGKTIDMESPYVFSELSGLMNKIGYGGI